MSLFSNILEKLGLKKPAAPAPKPGPTATGDSNCKTNTVSEAVGTHRNLTNPEAITHHPHANSTQNVRRFPPCT